MSVSNWTGAAAAAAAYGTCSRLLFSITMTRIETLCFKCVRGHARKIEQCRHTMYYRTFPTCNAKPSKTMKSAASTILLLAFVGVSLSSAFVPVSNQPTRCHVAFMASDDAETDSSSDGAVAGEAAAAADEEPPKPAVKCPDCDLCDGSGR